MTITETEHDWFVRQIPSALANGLSESERQRFDAHAASCAECGRAMYDAQEMENQLAAAIGDLRPEAGLEDRIVAELPRRLVIIGFRYRRVAAAVAGIVVVGAAGIFCGGLAKVGGWAPGIDHWSSCRLRISATGGGTDITSQRGRPK
jgi:anti-sigma factor RsiW